jgi:hypothetical protein
MTATESSDFAAVLPPARQGDIKKSLRCRRKFLKVFPVDFTMRPTSSGSETTSGRHTSAGKRHSVARSSAGCCANSDSERLRPGPSASSSAPRHSLLFSFEKMALRDAVRSYGALPVSARYRRAWLPLRPMGRGRRCAAASADPRADMADGDRMGLPRTAARAHILQTGRDKTRCRRLRQTAHLRITSELVDVFGTAPACRDRQA